jgi:hypothetical protein
MFLPMWIVWIALVVVGIPLALFAVGALLLMVTLGKSAEQNAIKRRRESLEVLSCSACRPLLSTGRCEQHRWHTPPPAEWVTAEALEVWDCPACGPIMEKIPCDKHRRQSKPLMKWVSRPAPDEWLGRQRPTG